MSDLTEKIQLLPEEHALILKHGYPLERLAKALGRWAQGPAVQRISMSRWELEMLIGELSRSFNHGESGDDEEAVLALCDRLEYAEQTGDGDLDCLAW